MSLSERSSEVKDAKRWTFSVPTDWFHTIHSQQLVGTIHWTMKSPAFRTFLCQIGMPIRKSNRVYRVKCGHHGYKRIQVMGEYGQWFSCTIESKISPVHTVWHPGQTKRACRSQQLIKVHSTESVFLFQCKHHLSDWNFDHASGSSLTDGDLS